MKFLRKILNSFIYLTMVAGAILGIVSFLLDRIGVKKLEIDVVVNSLLIVQILGFVFLIFLMLRLDRRLLSISTHLTHLESRFRAEGGSPNQSSSKEHQQKPEEEPNPSGRGAFGGMVFGGAIGLAIGGPIGVLIGGLIGALAGNKIEQEEVSRKQEESRAKEEERRIHRR